MQDMKPGEQVPPGAPTAQAEILFCQQQHLKGPALHMRFYGNYCL